MNVLAFAPQYNSKGKHDATGAFQPEAMAWAAMHITGARTIDNHRSKAQMRADVLTAICETRPSGRFRAGIFTGCLSR